MSDNHRAIVEKVNNAFENNDIEAFLDVCADNIRWTIVGEQEVSGKDAIRELMKSMECPDLPSFTIDKVISDGNSAAAYGGVTIKEETGGTASYSYCDIYTFDDDEKIAELRSFIITPKS